MGRLVGATAAAVAAATLVAGSPAGALAAGSDNAWQPVGVAATLDAPGWDLFGYGPGRDRAEHRPVKAGAAHAFPYLPGEPDGRSMSIGTVTDGRIVNAVPLPAPGRTYGVLSRQHRRQLQYGSQELITALVAASEAVDAAYPGAVLWFGNIGRRSGGDIPYSVSHNAGRDADLAFYVTDPWGRIVQPPDLLRHRADGRSIEFGGYYRFDDARNWALVRALATSPHAHLQYLFISNGLRARLLAHARALGEPADLVARASALMMEPGPNIPHDDHLHVRVHCSAADLTAGCEELGRMLSGTPRHERAVAAKRAQATALFDAEDAATRVNAVRRLALIGTRSDAAALRRAVSDPSPAVRAAAAQALAGLGGPADATALALRWDDEPDASVREAIVRATARLGGREAGEFYATLLNTPQRGVVRGATYDLRVVVADAAAVAGRPEPGRPLAELVGDRDRELAARALAALRVLTNAEVVRFDPRAAASDAERAAAARTATAWLDAWASGDRDEWVLAGFEALGAPVEGSASDFALALARALDDPRPWIRANAEDWLRRLSRTEPLTSRWAWSDRQDFWTRWVRRNRAQLRWPS